MDTSTRAHFSAPPPARPAASVDLMERWKQQRGISVGTFVPIERSQFLPDSCPAFTIINYGRDGEELPEHSRTRYDETHPLCPKDEKAQPIRYRLNGSPGQSVIFAPLPDSYARFAAAKEKWIAEGEGKALALAQLGLPVLGVGGCHAWHLKDQRGLHPNLDGVRPGDTVHIIFDGDVRTNDMVFDGAAGCMLAVRSVGAVPRFVLVSDNGSKEGIDDVIARWTREGKEPLAELAKLKRLDDLCTLHDYEFTSYDKLIERPFPDWIIDDLIQPGELTAMVGATSCGKSYLTQDLLMSVARGLPLWFGHDINGSGLCVHITLEGRGLDTRMKAYGLHHKLTSGVPYVALETAISLPNPDETARLIRSIQNHAMRLSLPVVLIAVDTVNRALGGGDENSSQDMGAFIRAADALRDAFPSAGVILVHHLGKEASRGARGHSSFSASVGGEFLIEDDNGTRTLTVTKQRDGVTGQKIHFTLVPLEVGRNSKGKPVTACVVELSLAPVKEADTDNRTRYQWIYSWYLGDQNNQQSVSKERVKDNVVNIRPARDKTTKMQLEAVFLWAVDKGLAVIDETARLKRGVAYRLLPPLEPKF